MMGGSYRIHAGDSKFNFIEASTGFISMLKAAET
jgi:hypothetical protein